MHAISALLTSVALISCQPTGSSNAEPTDAPVPSENAAGTSVGTASGTLDNSFQMSLVGVDSREEGQSTYSISVKLKWSPQADSGAGAWIDDGSTYTFSGRSSRTQHVTIGSGSCDVVWQFTQTGSGSFGAGDSRLVTSGAAAGSGGLAIGGRLAYVEQSTIDTCGTITTDETSLSTPFPPDACSSEEPPIFGPYAPANSRRRFEWNCDSSIGDSTSQFRGQVEITCWPQPVICPIWE